ncbi:MAG: NAD-dependent epimerase/dehydratase family protein [Candidatus Aminicenantes bacterium]|nr:NAD-dependent epimerase/dehydratase family protein [Candidatus Aminicenantes bacterium]NIQ68367.1 NAD-dependent epimerase/dehydratase family protein [Candidatus Aminicenantes bacterium]NIT24410.1 NAD-dependent epimerase/dehydratase family protein [Candidatus Aminicenantes bacterium]
MIALVTGGTGFVGGFLTEKLVEDGWEVYCLVRKTSSLEYLQNLPVNLIYGDLFSLQLLSEVMGKITHVFHAAGVTRAPTSEYYHQTNGLGTYNLLQACALQAKRLRLFVYVSSQAAAGPSPDGSPVREDQVPRPVSIYGSSKLEGEIYCARFQSQLPITIIRPPIVYGPRERTLYRYLEKQLRYGIRLSFKRHARLISLIHVHDLVRGILAAAVHPKSLGETYFLANPEPYSWSQFFDSIATVIDRKTISVTIPLWIFPIIAALSRLCSKLSAKPTVLNFGRLNEMRYRFWVCSSEKAREQLGFTTSLSLEDGLRQTVDWYHQNEGFKKLKRTGKNNT